jgi:hypothetical protein
MVVERRREYGVTDGLGEFVCWFDLGKKRKRRRQGLLPPAPPLGE